MLQLLSIILLRDKLVSVCGELKDHSFSTYVNFAYALNNDPQSNYSNHQRLWLDRLLLLFGRIKNSILTNFALLEKVM